MMKSPFLSLSAQRENRELEPIEKMNFEDIHWYIWIGNCVNETAVASLHEAESFLRS
jgi:hypothetical protein